MQWPKPGTYLLPKEKFEAITSPLFKQVSNLVQLLTAIGLYTAVHHTNVAQRQFTSDDNSY